MNNNDAFLPLTGYEYVDPEIMRDRLSQFYELMKLRRTVRSFAPNPVPRDIIETALRIAGTAPSGANHQPWYFVAISDRETKHKIRLAAEAEQRSFYDSRAPQAWLDALEPLGTDANKPFLETAPWLIVIFAQKRGGVTAHDDKKNYYVNESVGLATGLLITALHKAGLATLTHTPNPMNFLTEICGRPKDEKPFLLLVVGYPSADAVVPRHALIKKDLKDISHFIDESE